MNKITVIGLGAGDLEQLPLGVYRLLQAQTFRYARTLDHPVVKQLQQEGIHFESFDSIYEANDSFEEVYTTIVKQLIEKSELTDIIFAVPGHPLVAEKTVQLLIERAKDETFELVISGGQSFIDPMLSTLRIDPIEGFQLLDGLALTSDQLIMEHHQLIAQIYDQFTASDVKLTLMEKYADEYPVTIVTASGTAQEKVQTVPLYELDRVVEIDNLTTIYIPPASPEERTKDWNYLKQVVEILRSPEGCPWDREQTHDSLKKYLVEETYEVLQAINEQDDEAIAEELGDVLLQIFLHATIASEQGTFSLEDIIRNLTQKMIRRHPHVFGDQVIHSPDDVVTEWQKIKAKENGFKNEASSSALEGKERTDSTLLTAYNYQKAAAQVGFNYASIDGAIEKFQEEWQEFLVEIERKDNEKERIDEFGDVLFTLIKIGLYEQINPEEAMHTANQKFKARFQTVERKLKEQKKNFETASTEQIIEYWQEAKEEYDETR